MSFTTLISTDALHRHLHAPDWAVIDVRFSLADPEEGRRAYRTAHIPGAVYAHLDDDLSGRVEPGVTGRHPLPGIAAFAERLADWGITTGTQVVVYDDASGAVAARLWWMLRWLGHQRVAVLDGGWAAWSRERRPARTGEETRQRRTFVPLPNPSMIATADDVQDAVGTGAVLDARASARYRGEHEPIDPVAGHIPGARSVPFADNLNAQQHLLPAAVLRKRYETVLGDVAPEDAIVYCGSGVTAAHNALAMARAGLALPRLYVGSWSEWITKEHRPIAVGEESENAA